MRIGIDVGGTNTDAVLMDGRRVLGAVKTPTTMDVGDGIIRALQILCAQMKLDAARVTGVMIGTTHFTNAIVERRRLMPTAAIRLGLPATECLPPMVDWPDDLRQAIGGYAFLVHGGHEYDGRPISPFDEREVRGVARRVADLGIRAMAITSVFSPVNPALEEETAAIVRSEIPGVNVTLSHTIGRIGLLERENAAILNACLGDLARRIVQAFRDALAAARISAPFYLSQNDGTLMSAEFAEAYPVLTIASGPTNSMRGAAFLSGSREAIVVDVGGTTTDVGMLVRGFPREASGIVEIGGVRTNFRMPDVYSFGLGGGSLVVGADRVSAPSGPSITIGPQSVGYELTSQALVFGGHTLTATDVAVAAGLAEIGDPRAVAGLDRDFVRRVLDEIHARIEAAVDRMKISAAPLPVIAVGGGSVLIARPLAGASEIVKPEHFAAANAIGAAIAQVGGETDRVFSLEALSRTAVLDQAKAEATQKAIAAGADAATVQIVDVEEVPLAYLPGNATRIRVKAVGDLLVSQ